MTTLISMLAIVAIGCMASGIMIGLEIGDRKIHKIASRIKRHCG